MDKSLTVSGRWTDALASFNANVSSSNSSNGGAVERVEGGSKLGEVQNDVGAPQAQLNPFIECRPPHGDAIRTHGDIDRLRERRDIEEDGAVDDHRPKVSRLAELGPVEQGMTIKCRAPEPGKPFENYPDETCAIAESRRRKVRIPAELRPEEIDTVSELGSLKIHRAQSRSPFVLRSGSQYVLEQRAAERNPASIEIPVVVE